MRKWLAATKFAYRDRAAALRGSQAGQDADNVLKTRFMSVTEHVLGIQFMAS